MVYQLRDEKEIIDVLCIIYDNGYTHINGDYKEIKEDLIRAINQPLQKGDIVCLYHIETDIKTKTFCVYSNYVTKSYLRNYKIKNIINAI